LGASDLRVVVDARRARLVLVGAATALANSGISVNLGGTNNVLLDYADVVKHGKSGKLVWTRGPALQLGGDTLDTTGGYASYDGAADKLYLGGTDASARAGTAVRRAGTASSET